MPDLDQQLEFGVFPTPAADRIPELLALVQVAEVEGLDLVSVQDHPYQDGFLDTWTLLSVLEARTTTIRLAPNVASLPLRPPVLLAKAAASLDLLTDGRVELGLGAGAFWDGIVAAGGPRRSPGEAVDALAEAVELIRAFWAGGTLRFRGEHYRAQGLHAGPPPAHDIPIWLGAYKPRMLLLTGRLADAWVPSMGYADPPDLPALAAVVDEAALAAGRPPGSVRRIYNITGRFGTGGGFLRGTPAQWAEQLAELTVTVGMSSYVLGTDDADVVRRFAAEVAPATRELVEAERARRATTSQETPTGAATTSQETPTGAATTSQEAPTGVVLPGRADEGRGSGRHTVEPTPDDGRRLSPTMPWDEPSRPVAPDGAPGPHPEQAQHLKDIHDGLRGELAQVRDVLDQVRRGHLTVGAARSVVNTMTMRQNNWTLGAYCESYCRIVTGHHTLEDRSVFPHLRRAEPGLEAVLDRLEEEHVVIHDVLEQFDRALVRLVAEDGTGRAGEEVLQGVQSSLDLLTDTLLSHLAYEERELVGPLSRHGLS
ncbi:5,10-methylene tetrahydromethanopterin reductase [Serinicoccus chungangensis]|uniref:5,10-methylene tetrahydromethanopterin reductase n=1 Tax=Serinicoccus chungangensis TaxID=767452 RepID=A0A0W8I520_9MICO|nr:LLM class flavin-dependent oxidoreductase [Serinicoccus chungangensis]KUG53327.1 5,10-methylene tetrahydromethanopterin reductase [Serinicoccus chungangensis]